jgi:hypothetical protein
LKQEHIDASGTGSGGSCAARRDIGNSVRLTQALQAQHRSTSPFDAAMVLLKSVVEVATRSMPRLRRRARCLATPRSHQLPLRPPDADIEDLMPFNFAERTSRQNSS